MPYSFLKGAAPMTNANRLVIYYNSARTPLSAFAGTAYTHVILSFAEPDGSGTLVLDGNLLSSGVMSQVATLRQAGKTVLLSLGGGACTSAKWLGLSQDVSGTAQQMAALVQKYGLDGVDVDFEDSAALSGGSAGYDGTRFLIDLTNALYGALPATARTISHAPQPPYFYAGWGSAYKKIIQQVGSRIAFLNVQYYNNPNFQEAAYITGTATGSVAGIAAMGYPVQDIVVGKPVGRKDAGSGWMSADDLASQIVQPLVSKYGRIGGVMGWQAASDPDGTWATTLSDAMTRGNAALAGV